MTDRERASRTHLVRAVAAWTIALAGMIAASKFGDIRAETTAEKIVAIGGAAVFLVAGIVAVRSTAAGVGRAVEDRVGEARGAPLVLLVTLVGYVLVVVSTLKDALDVRLQGLLVGGALTGVVLGIAAQQSLSNLFAGLVLLVAKPFAIGDDVVLRSGALGGEYEGSIREMGLLYVTLDTANGPVDLPNAGVLAAAVGPGARASKGG